MIRHDDRPAVQSMHAATQLADRRVGVEQSMRGNSPDAEDRLRRHQLDLPSQVRQAASCFLVGRVPVLRRPALEHVCDIDLAALETCGAQHGIQQDARADRRKARPGDPRPRPAPRRSPSGARHDCPRRTPSACASRTGRTAGNRAPHPPAFPSPGQRPGCRSARTRPACAARRRRRPGPRGSRAAAPARSVAPCRPGALARASPQFQPAPADRTGERVEAEHRAQHDRRVERDQRDDERNEQQLRVTHALARRRGP